MRFRILPLLLACGLTPVLGATAHADPSGESSSKSLRDRAAKLDADAAADRAQALKGQQTASLARKTATEKAAAAAKLRTQAASISDAKAKAKALADADALDKEATKQEDEAGQLEGAVVALERRAKKLAAEAKRLRKQADSIDGK